MMRNIKQIEEFADHLGGNIVRRKLTHIESCRWNDRRCVNLSKKVGNIFSMQTLTSCIAKALPSDILVVHEAGGRRVRFSIPCLEAKVSHGGVSLPRPLQLIQSSLRMRRSDLMARHQETANNPGEKLTTKPRGSTPGPRPRPASP